MTRNEYLFYKKCDYMMNRGTFKKTFKSFIKNIFFPDYIIRYIFTLRKYEYFESKTAYLYKFLRIRIKSKLLKLGIKLGFSISPNVFGPGLIIPHFGTIVVGKGNKIGSYAVLHTCVCITEGKKIIGNALYMGTGSKIINDVKIGDNVSVGANAVVDKSFDTNNILLCGVPAVSIKKTDPWYLRDGKEYSRRVNECERLKTSFAFN